MIRWSRERFEDADSEDRADEATSQGMPTATRSKKTQGTDSPQRLQKEQPGQHLDFNPVKLILEF